MTLEQIGIFVWCAFGFVDAILLVADFAARRDDSVWVASPILIPVLTILGPVTMVVRKLQ